MRTSAERWVPHRGTSVAPRWGCSILWKTRRGPMTVETIYQPASATPPIRGSLQRSVGTDVCTVVSTSGGGNCHDLSNRPCSLVTVIANRFDELLHRQCTDDNGRPGCVRDHYPVCGQRGGGRNASTDSDAAGRGGEYGERDGLLVQLERRHRDCFRQRVGQWCCRRRGDDYCDERRAEWRRRDHGRIPESDHVGCRDNLSDAGRLGGNSPGRASRVSVTLSDIPRRTVRSGHQRPRDQPGATGDQASVGKYRGLFRGFHQRHYPHPNFSRQLGEVRPGERA